MLQQKSGDSVYPEASGLRVRPLSDRCSYRGSRRDRCVGHRLAPRHDTQRASERPSGRLPVLLYGTIYAILPVKAFRRSESGEETGGHIGTQPQPSDLAEIKKRQQRAWASGDYAMFGAALLIISELLCEAVDLRPGERVLDVAAGSGNTALAAARRFCVVTGIDYVPTLLERGRERAAAERLL